MVEALTAKLGAEAFAKIEKLVKEEFEERKYNVVRELRALASASASTGAT